MYNQCKVTKSELDEVLDMNRNIAREIRIRLFLKKFRTPIKCIICIAAIILYLAFGPRTVARGNGYSHQIGSFGKCDVNFDDCSQNATHRRHHLFDNEEYCESCWERYGQDMFERLSDTKPESNGIEYDEYKCRHSGCKNRAEYSEWERRFCAEHLQGTKYCRYPHCSEQIPISGTSVYCWKHK